MQKLDLLAVIMVAIFVILGISKGRMIVDHESTTETVQATDTASHRTTFSIAEKTEK